MRCEAFTPTCPLPSFKRHHSYFVQRHNHVSFTIVPIPYACVQQPSDSHNPLEDILFPNGILSSQKPSKEDRKSLEDIAAEGEYSFRELGDEAKQELESVSDTTAIYADKLIAEETAALMDKYADKQKELLDIVEQEKQVIQAEIDKIEDITRKPRSTKFSTRSKAASLWAINTTVFVCGAVTSLLNSVVAENNSDLYKAAAFMLAAAVCVTLFKKEKEKVVKEDAQAE